MLEGLNFFHLLKLGMLEKVWEPLVYMMHQTWPFKVFSPLVLAAIYCYIFLQNTRCMSNNLYAIAHFSFVLMHVTMWQYAKVLFQSNDTYKDKSIIKDWHCLAVVPSYCQSV